MLGPYIALIMDNSKINEVYLLSNFYNLIELNLSPVSFLSILLILVFAIRTLVAIFITKKILSFCRDVQISLRSSMMKTYQDMSYEEFISRDSSDAVSNITILSTYYTNNVLYTLLKASSEFLLAVFIFFFLISVNALLVFILSFGLFFLVLLYNGFFKKRMHEYGEKINLSNSNAIQAVKQSFQGVKEVRILGKENFFYKKLYENARQYAHLHANTQLITAGSKYFIEFSVIVFFVGSISLSSLIISSETSIIFGTLGVFAFASLRLLPGISVMSAAFLQLTAHKNTVERLYDSVVSLNLDFNTKEFLSLNKRKKNLKNFESLKLKNVSYKYPSSKENTLSKINLDIKKGESIGIIGLSGSGKTTLIDVLLGLLKPQKGEIFINNILMKDVINDWRQITAYIPQESLMLNETLEANIKLDKNGNSKKEDYQLSQSILQAQLKTFVNDLPEGVDTNIGESGIRLSGGQRQRVSLARAIFHSREILVFDEATSALDSETEKEVMDEIIKMKGLKTLIIIAHRTDTLKFCDRIYTIENGSIVENA